jgi:LPXTG-motif cell wall-anchored protein
MKRFVTFMMALIMILSLGITGFAADNTGSITINNATIDQTYTVYQIFDATFMNDSEGKTQAVSYSIKPENQFFSALFGADGKSENPFFVYEAATGNVQKKIATQEAYISYLVDLISSGSYTPAATPVKASGNEVKFDNLPYGYYVVFSTLGATVTITSNTPDAKVVDKNQEPATDFTKLVQTGVDENGNPVYGAGSSYGIGDTFHYQISFTATNYKGLLPINYYQITDTRGTALWVDIDNIAVKVGGETLSRGYYLCYGDPSQLNPGNREYLGNWGTTEKSRDNAQWYLEHVSDVLFRITIPWKEDHTLELQMSETVPGQVVGYTITYPEQSLHKFASTTNVEVVYPAAVQADAITGGGTVYNKAEISSSAGPIGGGGNIVEPPITVTGFGIEKIDSATREHLADVQFRLFQSVYKAGTWETVPLYVIPTDLEGVYILDSFGTDADDEVETSREKYEEYLEGYLGKDYATKQDNLVVTPVNGKVVVLGLEQGMYYVQEVKAPDGYNSVSTLIPIDAYTVFDSFDIYTDANGKAVEEPVSGSDYTKHSYYIRSVKVENSRGIELPSTGGEGTMMLIAIGIVMAVAFAILLITQKKMSIYRD